jgi:hypothetical protein
MRRIQIYIEEALDEALQTEAAKRGCSKAALIRECVAAKYDSSCALENDSLTALVGAIDAEPGNIDEEIYESRGLPALTESIR